MKIENNVVQPAHKRRSKAYKNKNMNVKSLKRSKGKLNVNFFVPLIAMIFVILMLITMLASDSAIFKIQSKQEKYQKLKEQLTTIKRKNEQRRSKIINSPDRSFEYERLARRQGLKKPGEIIINIPDRSVFIKKANELIENYEKRVNFSYKEIKENIKTSRIVISAIFGIIFIIILGKFITTSPVFIRVPKYFEDEPEEIDIDADVNLEKASNDFEIKIPGYDEAEMQELMKIKAELASMGID